MKTKPPFMGSVKRPAENPQKRADDIERAALELEAMIREDRAKYILKKSDPRTDYISQVLARANASNLTDFAFRALYTFATYARSDGTNAFPSHQTIANITNSKVRTSERAVQELTKAGWIKTRHEFTRGYDKAIREIVIPQASYDAFPVRGHTPDAFNPDASEEELRTVKNGGPYENIHKDRQKWRPRPAKNGGGSSTTDLSVSSRGEPFAKRPSNVVDFETARNGGVRS